MINILNETTALARRTTVTELCRAWTDSTDKIRDGFARLIEAQDAMSQVFQGGNHSLSIQHYRREIDFAKPDATIEHFKRDVWRAIIEQLGLRKLLSLKRIAEMDKQLETGEGLPEITPDNINSMLETNLAQMGDFLKEKVYEVYEYLRPSNKWRPLVTNTKSLEAGVGKKVILGYAVQRSYAGGFQVNYHRQDELRALDQVFHMLDGKAPPASYHGDLSDAINKTPRDTNTVETEYFKAKCFGNGNLHLEIKRADLLAQFNVIAGGARLTDTKNQN